MTLKLMPFESLGAVSYSPSIVTCGRICSRLWDIQCQKWRDLENQVRGQGHWKWRRSIDHMRLSIGRPL